VLALGFLITKITTNKEALSAIVNVVALASSFLCGAFIPTHLMPEAVVAVGRVLPTFYYIDNNNALAQMTTFSGAVPPTNSGSISQSKLGSRLCSG